MASIGVELAVYPSKSTPNKHYTVRRGKDDVIYCDCWQWKRNRTCSHLEEYLHHVASGKHTTLAPTKKIDVVAQAIESAVVELGR